MTKSELIAALKLCNDQDTETGHMEADTLIIDYLNDPEIKEAYDSVRKWFA